jgi:hypothetical protein
MEAMSTSEKLFLLTQNPDLKEEEINEYERLLSERFAIAPDLVEDAAVARGGIDPGERIRELYYRIYKVREEGRYTGDTNS